ncbi:MAG: molybdopterin-dependent oxidoreductase [Candidatus Thermoplasmatota archaeon]|nr:molybdopterin-dependent oxidoreductase [Candidatus Thermoplasmatota archaeon]
MDNQKIHVENPGQRYITNWIIYSAIDEPEIDREKWHLTVNGLVKKQISYGYRELQEMPQLKYTCDFNCVTAWSIKDVNWEGPSLRDLIMRSEPSDDADWVMFKCAEGYSTPIPLEYAMTDAAVIALKINGKELNTHQGFPARPFLPELYGWKSAKWLTEVELISGYKEGYWEKYGYHERGLVDKSERYTGNTWKRVKKNVTAMFKT